MIDSGSTKNLVSLENVEKIKPEKLSYHCSYKVSWLTKGHKNLVNEQSWVEL